MIDALTGQLERSWRDVRAGRQHGGPFLAGLTTVLGPADGHVARTARQRVWTALVADATPHDLGARARTTSATAMVHRRPRAQSHNRSPLRRVSAGPMGARPLDRSVVDRLRATLRRGLDRDELPAIPLLCAEEVDRACAPWGLLSEDKQATLIAGIEIAGDLAPLSERVSTRYGLGQTDCGQAS